MFPGSSKADCCDEGKCKPQQSDQDQTECQKMPLVHERTGADSHVQLMTVFEPQPVTSPVLIALNGRWQPIRSLDPLSDSPPDFSLLHSTFLI